MNIITSILLQVLVMFAPQPPQGVESPQIEWNATLQSHVNPDGKVNYEGIIKNHQSLEGYLTWLEGIDLEKMSADQQLATLINAYNAFTIQLIVEHWPIKSIKDISSRKRWTDRRWKLGGDLVSLDDIEHTMIRPVFEQPLIHFALVCGANGCPPLRSELYVEKEIDQQLFDQAQKTHNNKNWYRYDRQTKKIHITKLYKWYKKDFVKKTPTIQHFVANFDPLVSRAIQTDRSPSIQYLDYDWSLNKQSKVEVPSSK